MNMEERKDRREERSGGWMVGWRKVMMDGGKGERKVCECVSVCVCVSV